MKILITGASGSGTSTLGAALAKAINARYVDADDYYWLPTSPPFQEKRDGAERLAALIEVLGAQPDTVLGGSIMEWGAELENGFDLIVFLYLPADIRVARLTQRETARFGKVDPIFLSWAAQYDEGVRSGRSLVRHQDWLSKRGCPVLRLEGDISVDERVRLVNAALADTI